MRLYLRLAWRNIWRHKRRTIIVVLAIGLSMALMMWYDGLIGGFNEAIYGNAIRVLGGNIQIHAPGYGAEVSQLPLLPLSNDTALVKTAEAQPTVMAAARRINTGGMATTHEGAFGVTIGPGAIPRQLSGFVHDANNDIQQGSRGSVALNPPINGARSDGQPLALGEPRRSGQQVRRRAPGCPVRCAFRREE